MKIKYDPEFIKKLKKQDVRIRKSFRARIALFQKDPNSSELNNHLLEKDYSGYRSIDITNDYRAVYKEVDLGGDEPVAYFSTIGTHDELYG